MGDIRQTILTNGVPSTNSIIQTQDDYLNSLMPWVTVTAKAPKKMSTQSAKPSFWDKVINGINSVTGQIQLGNVQAEASVNKDTLFIIGGVLLAIVAMLKFGGRKRH